MLAIALALGASLSWGLGDFLGGLKSRTLHVLTVLVLSQVVGITAALAWVAASGDDFPGWSASLLAVAAGVSGCLGIATLYRGMAIGVMGVVAPVSAVAAVIPFTVGMAALAVGASLRPGRASFPALAAVGVCDVGANMLFSLATTRGFLSVISVLSALYPIVTVALAALVLHESVSALQRLGVAGALAGAALITAG